MLGPPRFDVMSLKGKLIYYEAFSALQLQPSMVSSLSPSPLSLSFLSLSLSFSLYVTTQSCWLCRTSMVTQFVTSSCNKGQMVHRNNFIQISTFKIQLNIMLNSHQASPHFTRLHIKHQPSSHRACLYSSLRNFESKHVLTKLCKKYVTKEAKTNYICELYAPAVTIPLCHQL